MLRIDAFRGIALWCIFLDHIPNNAVGSWLTLRNYGFSDAAEVFMFVGGATCALAYSKAWRCEGWTAVIRRTLRRSWNIDVAFLLLTLACAILVHLAGGGRLADESNTRILLDHPGATLAHAAILQYRPVNTDVLPIFVLLHLLFAPLLWLLLRLPNVTLGASLALYALVHVFGWTVPGAAERPLGLQSAGLAAAGCAWRVVMLEENRVWRWVTSRTVLGLAVLYLLFSLVIALSWRIKPLEALIPQTLAKLHQLDKLNLSIAIAAFFSHSGFGSMVRASQLARAEDAGDARRDLLWPELATNLLPRRSAGVRRPHGAVRHSDGLAMQIAAQSRWHRGDDRDRNAAELDHIKPRQQSAIDSTLPSENSRTIMSHSIGRDLADGRQRARISHVKVEARIAAFETTQADEAEKAGSLFIAPGRPKGRSKDSNQRLLLSWRPTLSEE